MKYEKKVWISCFWILLGAVLIGFHQTGRIEEFWCSMGVTLAVVGAMQVIRQIRYRTDGAYREKFDTETRDERNRFLSTKAWAWAGWWFVMIAAAATVVLKLLGREELMMMASGSVCVMMLLYWCCYLYLKRKY